MQKPKVDKKLQNSITLLLLFIIIIIGVFFGIIKPQAKTLKNSNIELAAKQRELIAKEDKLKDLKKLENTIEEVRNSSDLLIKALPSEKDLPGLLVQVEAIAKRLKVSLSNFSLPSEGSETTNTTQNTENIGLESSNEAPNNSSSSYSIKTLAFPFNTTGEYTQIIEFLNVLQNNLRIFKINSLNISAPEEGSTSFSITVNVTTYYIETSNQLNSEGGSSE